MLEINCLFQQEFHGFVKEGISVCGAEHVQRLDDHRFYVDPRRCPIVSNQANLPSAPGVRKSLIQGCFCSSAFKGHVHTPPLRGGHDNLFKILISGVHRLNADPLRHLAHLAMHATTDHESVIDLRGATPADIDHMRRHYYANITTVDEKLGEVLDALAERGNLEDSLLIFCSDHGELLGDHGLAYKWLMYDPIVHVPLVIRYPDSVNHPRDVGDLVSLMDIGPTVLDAAGIDVPTYFEGHSLMPYLNEESILPREFVFCEDNYQIMMRSQDYKLVYYIVSLVKGFCPVPVRVYAHFGHGFRTSQNTSVAHGQNPIRHR